MNPFPFALKVKSRKEGIPRKKAKLTSSSSSSSSSISPTIKKDVLTTQTKRTRPSDMFGKFTKKLEENARERSTKGNLFNVKKEDLELFPWVDKYRPSMIQGMLGHKRQIEALNKFLREWTPSTAGALLTGPPGIGKTTCAHLAAVNCGFIVLEINASNIRTTLAKQNKKGSSHMTRTIQDSIGEAIKRNTNTVILMDEIDGITSMGTRNSTSQDSKQDSRKPKQKTNEHMSDSEEEDDDDDPNRMSDEDGESQKMTTYLSTKDLIKRAEEKKKTKRGCMTYIIECLKKTRIPFIFTANDRFNRKLKPLLPYCKDIKLYSFEPKDIIPKLISIATKEHVKIDQHSRQIINTIASTCNGDLRQAINRLEAQFRFSPKKPTRKNTPTYIQASSSLFQADRREKSIFDVITALFTTPLSTFSAKIATKPKPEKKLKGENKSESKEEFDIDWGTMDVDNETEAHSDENKEQTSLDNSLQLRQLQPEDDQIQTIFSLIHYDPRMVKMMVVENYLSFRKLEKDPKTGTKDQPIVEEDDDWFGDIKTTDDEEEKKENKKNKQKREEIEKERVRLSNLETYSLMADFLSDGDLVDKNIHESHHYDLTEENEFLSCVSPCVQAQLDGLTYKVPLSKFSKKRERQEYESGRNENQCPTIQMPTLIMTSSSKQKEVKQKLTRLFKNLGFYHPHYNETKGRLDWINSACSKLDEKLKPIADLVDQTKIKPKKKKRKKDGKEQNDTKSVVQSKIAVLEEKISDWLVEFCVTNNLTAEDIQFLCSHSSYHHKPLEEAVVERLKNLSKM